MQQRWSVYLAGEIHSDWRQQIAAAVNTAELPVDITTPVTDHDASDTVGVRILGGESAGFWQDHKGARINAIRTRRLIRAADVVVVRFGDKYRQWNAAFDAGFAVALDKALIVIHDEDLNHALKEVDAAALAVTRTPAQVVDILAYVVA